MNSGNAFEIDAVLRRLGLGTLDWDSATVIPGRNTNWTGRTTSGRRVFVKKVLGPAADVRGRVRRTAAFYRTARTTAVLSPRCLGQDDDAGIQVFDHLEDARTGSALAHDGSFGPPLGAQAGTLLGSLHSAGPAQLTRLEAEIPPTRHQNLFTGLTAEMFYDSSQAQLEAWRMAQQDRVLLESLATAGKQEESTVKLPVHADIRLDQFLLARGRLYLTDWEEFRLADPAQDVGSFVGEWIHHAVRELIAGRSRMRAGKPVPVPTIALTSRWREFSLVRPVVQSFWLGYREVRPVDDPDFTRRSAMFAAWHLVERILADAAFSPRLDGSARALFTLSRTILTAPERFVATLGLGELT